MKKKNSVGRKTFKLIIAVIILSLIIGAGYIVSKGYKMYKDALNQTPLEVRIAQIETKKDYTKISDVPEIYKNAVVAVEDHRFYKHSGIDIISIGRAVYTDIINQRLVEGGSTITQQLAKNMYFTHEKSFVRKIAEAFMSLKIERTYSKDVILELYMNNSYYGNGCYTLKEASQKYFGKNPKDLTEYEATLISGIPNAPNIYDPIKNPELTKQRQEQVLRKMVKYNYISNEDADKIINNKK